MHRRVSDSSPLPHTLGSVRLEPRHGQAGQLPDQQCRCQRNNPTLWPGHRVASVLARRRWASSWQGLHEPRSIHCPSPALEATVARPTGRLHIVVKCLAYERPHLVFGLWFSNLSRIRSRLTTARHGHVAHSCCTLGRRLAPGQRTSFDRTSPSRQGVMIGTWHCREMGQLKMVSASFPIVRQPLGRNDERFVAPSLACPIRRASLSWCQELLFSLTCPRRSALLRRRAHMCHAIRKALQVRAEMSHSRGL